MTKKILLVFATEAEARITRSSLPEHHEILIAGMGPKAVLSSLSEKILLYDTVINAGIVGSMRDEIPIGSLVPIQRVYYENESGHIIVADEGYTLLTVDAPLYHKKNEFDLVDMEGYMVAKLCKQANKELIFIKIVSDIVSKLSSQHIRERLPELSCRLATHISDRVGKQ